ncbi:nuclease [Azospirillum brasilense]|uniref:Nuclease n=1 Tax=Azospirillum brasilense TaxID=192 RepID=A0A4D8QL22_AZOBR|nr:MULTISPECIES: thermonuclease family protein [Azospirillum]MDW7556454.1 thermonuclease family protein [Azospirillum brasilense]MDW7596134.1 thermonuclease family protein [Azospirillum brasilense]MDW7631217.1 thermonuclease family protein [Azospirillum brasilense]MDX5952912.1 thermonuclease family protein [Azospirillum brasilense]NUB26989.1 nuclease [Azospirillum brasilense]
MGSPKSITPCPRRTAGLWLALLSTLLVPLLAGTVQAAPPALPGPIPAEVLEVLDGDTLLVRATIWLGQVVETHVRVDGLDAPEMRARCPRERELAETARDHARRLIGAAPVRLLDIQPDKYGGRVRARVLTIGGDDLSAALIEAGLARPYHGERRQPWCDGTGMG